MYNYNNTLHNQETNTDPDPNNTTNPNFYYIRFHEFFSFNFQTVGNKITPLVVNPGRIVLTNVTLYFQPYNNAEPVPVFKVKLVSIKRIFQRRYLILFSES